MLEMKLSRSMKRSSSGSLVYLRATSPVAHRRAEMRRRGLFHDRFANVMSMVAFCWDRPYTSCSSSGSLGFLHATSLRVRCSNMGSGDAGTAWNCANIIVAQAATDTCNTAAQHEIQHGDKWGRQLNLDWHLESTPEMSLKPLGSSHLCW